MADGFLGRWSRRKQDLREGRPLATEPAAAAAAASPSPASGGGRELAAPPMPVAPAAQRQATRGEEEVVDSPLPSLEDVQALTPASDFAPFVARGVAPEVKNAAMKKLFADPHYNLMDRLDIYIDDYSQPDPLPLSMLRQMTSAKFLNLFDDEKSDNAVASQPIDRPTDSPAAPPTPEAALVPTASHELNTEHHAHTDLRLQQDHAAGAQGPGGGAE